MADAVFVDTTVLLNLLDVPRNNDRRDQAVRELRTECSSGSVLILPLTSIIETGNAIVRDAGGKRHQRSMTFVDLVKAALSGVEPWTLSGAGLGRDLVVSMVDGHASVGSLTDLMTHGIGTGDACILAEVHAYRERVPSATPVRIWSYDANLVSYA